MNGECDMCVGPGLGYPTVEQFSFFLPSSLDTQRHLQLVDGDPGVRGEVLHHGHQEHEASGPVPDQQHQGDELDDLDERVGHVQELVSFFGVFARAHTVLVHKK